jgi:beta-lactamase regulating signal transducer with metallopeptidase domain
MDALLNWLWQGGVVAITASLMLRALGRACANVRYVVCWAAAVLITSLPALPQLRTSAVSQDVAAAASIDAVVSLPDAWWTSTVVMLAAWTLWATVQIVRFVVAILAIRRARARARSFPSEVESILPHWNRLRRAGRRATLVVSDSVTTAAVLGWGAPMIAVAPSLLTRLDGDELDRVLIHEWAHVQRRDDLTNILQVVVRVIGGWHPALRWIDRSLHVEREIACDEMTIATTGSPKCYAECLMKLANLRDAQRTMRIAPAIFTAPDLRARITKIVSSSPSLAPGWARGIAAASVTALCVTSFWLGELKVVEAADMALPFVLSRPLSTPLVRPESLMVAGSYSDTKPARAPRAGVQGLAPGERPRSEQPSDSQKSEAQSSAPLPPAMPAPVDGVNASAAAQLETEHATDYAIGEAIPIAPPRTPVMPSDVTAQSPQSPWSAAAAGGTAIGRKSRDTGVATAGFFTRFARRVAGSF